MSSRPVSYVACPMCAWNRPIFRRGNNARRLGRAITRSKGLFHYSEQNLDKFEIVRFMVSHGRPRTGEPGAKTGFEWVDGLTLDQMLVDPDWAWIVNDIYRGAKDIVDRIESVLGGAEARPARRDSEDDDEIGPDYEEAARA